MYADDMVLISDNEIELQEMLNPLNEWCSKWHVKMNKDKSKIVHFRKSKKKKTLYQFKLGKECIDIVSCYKYLGILLDENLNFKDCANLLSSSAGRALGSVISKCKSNNDVGYKTFCKMYETGVDFKLWIRCMGIY